MKKALSVILALILALSFLLPAAAKTAYLYDSWHIPAGSMRATAHRGYSAIAPENTLPAFRLAGEAGFWAAECDIHLTADGVWVVSHDTTIDRMTDGTGAIADMTYDELMTYTVDAGNNIENYPGLKTPTLAEYLDVMKEYGLHDVIEIKDIPSGDFGSLAAILNAREEKENFIIISFDRAALRAVRPLMPDTPMYLLESPATQDGIDFCLEYGIDGIDFSYITPDETVYAVQAAGLETMVWTVDDIGTAERYYACGVRDITTNSLVPGETQATGFLRRLVFWFRDLFDRLLSLFGRIRTVPGQGQLQPPAGARTVPVKVMSYNVYVVDDLIHAHEKRAPGVAANIANALPDVFGLQEANQDWMQRIPEALPEYSFVGCGRDDGETAGEYSPVFYLTEKYDLADGGTFWFSDTPDTPSRTWGSRYNRICSWAVLTEKASGKSFAVFNSHWDHLSVESRNRSAALLLEKIAEYAPDLPVVITGDFNCKPNTVAYKTLTDGGFVDSMYVSPETSRIGTFHGYYKLNTENELPIDHILFLARRGYSASYRVIADKIDGAYPSDHFPIVAELTLW